MKRAAPGIALIALSAIGPWACSSARGPTYSASRSGSVQLTGFRARVVAIAEREWRYFGRHQRGWARRNGRKEWESGYSGRVLRYWREGVGREVGSSRVAWSGAFISYVMRKAGAGRRFAYSGSHAPNIRRAIGRHRSNPRGKGFFGRRLGRYSPRPGDLVCNALVYGVDYDNTPQNWSGHCDIVVHVRRRSIDVIGGNLSDTVGKRTLRTDDRGRVLAHQPRGVDPYVKRWFVIVESRL